MEKAHPQRTYREANALSLAALASKVGTTRQYLSMIELGTATPSLDMVRKLCEETGLSADDYVEAMQT